MLFRNACGRARPHYASGPGGLDLRGLLVLLAFSGSAIAAEPVTLQAGRLSLVFEPDLAFVRYVKVGELKVLQGISAPVRDRNWGTVPPQVANVQVRQTDDAFELRFDVTCRQGAIEFVWHGTITGNAKGELAYDFDGEAQSEFLRNRIGFCVLHGPEVAGRKCRVEMVDGQIVDGHFPALISPHQPFKNIRAISHELSDGVWARVQMQGDIFEMEDQRNWTDASFKTYCTPLEKPYPVLIPQGTKIGQRIEISIDGLTKVPLPPKTPRGPVVVQVSPEEKARHELPGLGLQVSSQSDHLSAAEFSRLEELRLDHLRVDITPAEPGAAAKLQRAADQAKRLGVQLVVGLHLGKNIQSELASLTEFRVDVSVTTWLLIDGDDAQVPLAKKSLARSGPKWSLGRGENTNFTELNRKRPNPSTIGIVSFGMNPQIHAFDNTSMVETLPIQADTVKTARQFTAARPLLISPITLKPASATNQAGQLPAGVDPRQVSLFAAGWTLGSVKYLAEANIEGATYYETVGWLGVMESESGSPLPQQFPSQPGQLYPIYYLFRELALFKGGQVRETSSSDPMAVVGLTVEKDDRKRLFLANLSGQEQSARVQGLGDRPPMHRLEAQGFVPFDAISKNDPGTLLTIPPHVIVMLGAK